MATPKIKSKAVLIGYSPDGKCVYSEILDLSEYYDAEHLWDKSGPIKRLRLQKLRGFLFNPKGILYQEFENIFDFRTGVHRSGYIRFADGTVQKL